MCFGNWFMGCRADSSERNFGRTFFSSKFQATVIYKHSCEPSATTRMPDGRLILSHLCNSYTPALIVSIHPVSVRSLSITFMVINDTYLISSICLSNCLSNNCRSWGIERSRGLLPDILD